MRGWVTGRTVGGVLGEELGREGERRPEHHRVVNEGKGGREKTRASETWKGK